MSNCYEEKMNEIKQILEPAKHSSKEANVFVNASIASIESYYEIQSMIDSEDVNRDKAFTLLGTIRGSVNAMKSILDNYNPCFRFMDDCCRMDEFVKRIEQKIKEVEA